MPFWLIIAAGIILHIWSCVTLIRLHHVLEIQSQRGGTITVGWPPILNFILVVTYWCYIIWG